ncbi:hypothetical protein LSAT2_009115 [Lamellibrachia satsuma]|nr:hypothetical protein LSAT2_009115 [Lamellibrachia satsuma]
MAFKTGMTAPGHPSGQQVRAVDDTTRLVAGVLLNCFNRLLNVGRNNIKAQMSSAHIVTLCVYVLTLAGPANGMLGPGVDFNPESFHWAMTDVLTNAGFKRMEHN